ncbi:MAG: hypothetical protein GY940_32025, partial [bacterium]|nr:hypothetical protein [bacterium]
MVEVNLMRIKIKEKSVILSYLLIGLGLFYIGGAALNAAIPAIEREALIALYNATGGDHWKRNTGWKGNNNEIDGFSQIGSEGTWYGITIMADHIISIDLRGNNLTGSIPKELGNPGHLVELFLNNNDLSGVPPELGNLSNLKKLYLGRNNLSSIPDIGNLTNLQVLQLGYNPLTTIPTGIGNLINLEHFYIAGVESLTSLPPEIGKLKNLTGFYLYKCSIHSLPAEIGDLSRLERFYISHNKLSSLPAEMGQLHNLESLDLSHNNLTSLPPELGNLKRIDRFFLNHNRITGIPPELGNLSTLWGLELEFNRLTWLPPELGNLDNLNSIKLGDNYLAAIPEAVFGMESLVYLNLGNNRIEGPIPDEIGDLRNLEELNLGSNNLTGPVPVSILKLTNLECGLFGRPWEFNRLFSNNERVKAFLARMGIYWENTQTVPPTQVSASPVFSTSVKVSWQPIKFIWKTGGYQVYYSTGPSGPWTYAGMTASKSEAFLYIHGLTPGQTFYFRVRTKTDAHNENSNPLVSHPGKVVSAVIPQTVPAPFGSMDTPANDSVVSSSIPVSGWAISNTGVENVKIYSEQDEGLVYMGDSVFVEGARPDIESLFPGFPNNHKAGWGYMLLTNLLPNNGNGTFVIHAIAMDVNGETSTLGTKTIHCDNANAVKPFGAIDTPTQGGAASGSGFVNFGWALTPQPNTIPVDGST